MKTRIFFTLFFLSTLGAYAQDAGTAEARLRDALRNSTLQLRTAETERANLHAASVALEEKIKKLDAQVAEFSKQAEADQGVITTQTTKLAEREQRIAALEADVSKWKTNYTKAAEILKGKESALVKATDKAVQLQRVVEDQRLRNSEMFRVGKEILSRYEKFGLGTALAAREPFIGTTRVKLENLVQDYSEQLDAQRIKP